MFRIMCMEGLNMELKSNCGHIFVLVEKVENTNKLLEEVSLLSSEGKSEDGRFSLSSPGPVLALLHGLLSTCSKEFLTQCHQRFLSPVLLCYLKIAEHDKETQSMLGVSKGLVTYSQKLLDHCKQTADATFLENLKKDVFEYIWTSLDQPVDSVKHNTKSFIKNIIESLLAGSKNDIVDQFLKDTMKLPLHSKSRLISLSCLVQSYQVVSIMSLYPDIVTDNVAMILQETAIGNLITDLICNILVKMHRERHEGWLGQVVSPLIQLYTRSSSQAVTNCLISVLNSAAKIDVRIIDNILEDKSNLPNKLALTCLKMCRDRGRAWSFEKHESLIQSSMCDYSEDVRLQALTLCVESHSSVEVFSPKELLVMSRMILSHLDLQSPSSQQVLVVLVNKMLQRMNDGAAALCKKLTQNKFEKDHQQMEQTLKNYNEMIQSFTLSLLDNLYPGANYQRRTTVLDILTSISSIIGFQEVQNRLDMTVFVTETFANTMLACLDDSYEANKEKALSLLLTLPPSVLLHDHPEHVRARLDTCVTLMTSNKPPDTLTASYMARLLIPAPALHWVLADKLGLLQASQFSSDYLLVVFLRNLLSEQLAVAEVSLLDAAVTGPLYGSLGVLRAVYTEITGSRSEWSETWVGVTRDIVKLCQGVWRAVSGVVVSDSPEGHLPCDGGKVPRVAGERERAGAEMLCTITSRATVSEVFSDEIAQEIIDELVDELLGDQKSRNTNSMVNLEHQMASVSVCGDSNNKESLSEAMQETETEISKSKEVSSQMLLLCAWRSVKEVSLFLGDLCATFRDTGSNLISVKQILDISTFLVNLLTDTKHRGAFEQAFTAYSSLCGFLWRSSQPQLHSQPQQMLGDILDAVTDTKRSEKSSLCSTRRSAGIPFIVQAVLTTDPDTSAALLRLTMERLLRTAGDSATNPENRVHCLNILRAVFRDSKLGELIARFVEAGVRLAVTGYRSADWAERNASTLLFSALVTRIFGVKREKDSVSSKNCLTGKSFFQRYPSLHQFFLDQLSDPELDMTSRKEGVLVLDCVLYPVLLVLSRIYPSPTEGISNPYQLSAFVPFVQASAASSILQTRQLAAAALVPLVTREAAEEFLMTVTMKVSQGNLCQNNLHGNLLIIKEFLTKYPSFGDTVRDGLMSESVATKMIVENNCCLTNYAYLVILRVVGKPPPSVITMLVKSSLNDTSLDVWRPLMQKEAANLVVKEDISKSAFEDTAKLLLNHPEYEVRIATLKALSPILHATEVFPFTILLERFGLEEHSECLAALLECCSKMPGVYLTQDDLMDLIELSEKQDNDSIKGSILDVCSKMDKSDWDENSVFSFSVLVNDSLETENPSIVREAAARALAENITILMDNNLENIDASTILWTAVLRIFMDDEPRIRKYISQIWGKISGSMTSPNLAQEKLLQTMVDRFGFKYTARLIFMCVGSILTFLYDGLDQSGDLDPDKAYDKNETNCYQEVIGHALKLLPSVKLLIRKLSPKMQESTFKKEIPSDLLSMLIPELPDGSDIENLGDLVQFIDLRLGTRIDETEKCVLKFISHSLECNFVKENFSNDRNKRAEGPVSDALFHTVFRTFVEESCDNVKR